ncbi:hypothetical protein ACN94_07100 [Gordonia paraffinivorans]|uniref:Uncharacterized protein n=2 Tax=Gordonia paraffinivorans TaxID=175628 RepID=A0ABD7V2L8_9ACTN|nr:hypothetical protein [Gordonia paraffinivorans]MBY4573351.1 hypothetical protein [Gordonia paraffinivorans]VFA88407.1 Uncharacterised protein [Gordonia paraffinivorans]
MTLKPGTRLCSQTCDTEVVVVTAPDSEVELTCGGAPLVPKGEPVERVEISAGLDTGTQLGKRYTSEDAPGLEVLVTKAGAGTLAIGTTPLEIKAAKPLPASD